MDFEHRKQGNILLVRPLAKRIDAAEASDFKGRMVDWINEGNNQIILDLAEVDFIDSSGLGAIISSLKALGSQGELVICGVRQTVLSLFELTRMNRVFQMARSSEEALGLFHRS